MIDKLWITSSPIPNIKLGILIGNCEKKEKSRIFIGIS